MSEIKKNEPESKVVLSLPENTFADMIMNFLGKKEKLSYQKRTYFKLHIYDITQFYYLLDAKISKEQFTHLNYFSLVITYDDSTTREINTIERLEKYHETRNVIPTSISMSWNIVLKFPKADTIENQKIDLLFNITDEVIDGNVYLDIQHTNPAWGVEVLNLFTDNIKKVSLQENKNIGFINSVFGVISSKRSNRAVYYFMMLVVSLTMSILLLGLESNSNNYSRSKADLATEVYNLSSNGLITDRELMTTLNAISYLKDDNIEELLENKLINEELVVPVEAYISKSKEKIYTFIKIVLSIFFSLIGIYFFGKYYYNSYINFYRDISLINITDAANKKLIAFNESKNKAVFYSLSLIIFSVVCSLIATLITVVVQ